MPTHPQAFVDVADALDGRPLRHSAETTATFFSMALSKYADDARAVIFDFLVACTDPPTEEELHALVNLVGTADKPKRLPAEVIDFQSARAKRVAAKRPAYPAARKTAAKKAAPKRAAQAKPATKRVAQKPAAKTLQSAASKSLRSAKSPVRGDSRSPKKTTPRRPSR